MTLKYIRVCAVNKSKPHLRVCNHSPQQLAMQCSERDQAYTNNGHAKCTAAAHTEHTSITLGSRFFTALMPHWCHFIGQNILRPRFSNASAEVRTTQLTHGKMI